MTTSNDNLAQEVNPRQRGRFLKNLADFLTELARVQAGFLPGITDWEMRQSLPEMIFRHLRRAQDLRGRCKELGVTLGDTHISCRCAARELLDRLCAAPDHAAFVRTAVVRVPEALVAAIAAYQKNNDTIYDRPSQPLLEAARADLEAQIARGREWSKTESTAVGSGFVANIEALLADLTATLHEHAKRDAEMTRAGRRIGRLPLVDAVVPEGFKHLENGPEAPAPDADYTARSHYVAVNFLQEVQAADSCAALLFDAPDMPWEFYFDVARHLWDECRHALFGARKLAELGTTPAEAGLSTKAYAMRQTLTPLDRYAALTTQEADAFPGKHAGLKEALTQGDATSAMGWSYDIADETQHVRFGTKWIPVMIEAVGEPRSYAQIQSDLRNWRATVLAEAYRPAAVKTK